MEKISMAMGASTIELSEAGLRITILRSFWRPKQWQRRVSLPSQVVAVGWSWLNRPRPGDWLGGVSDEEASQPRWKKRPLEGLSYVLFIRLVPANHGLRQLDKAIDWWQIDRRGAPAYRPQGLFWILG